MVGAKSNLNFEMKVVFCFYGRAVVCIHVFVSKVICCAIFLAFNFINMAAYIRMINEGNNLLSSLIYFKHIFEQTIGQNEKKCS